MSTRNAYAHEIETMPPGLERGLLRVMSFHVGRRQALGRMEVVAELRKVGYAVSERQARQCIHAQRRAGHLICSAPGEEGGYYLAADLAEFREFCERELHPKALDMLETESAMKAAAKEQFGEAVQGQLI
jgi:hypothetical protein